MRRILSLVFILALAGCASANKPLQEPPPNPYAKNYTSLLTSPSAKSTAEPAIYRGKEKGADQLHLLEAGYDMLGYSAFDAGSVPPELLTSQAMQVHADLVLVYTRKAGGVPASVKLDQAKSRAVEPPADAPQGHLYQFDNDLYQYYASYWVKLPTPVLGVHVQRDRQAREDQSGLNVIAVIHNSPAEKSGVKRGDTLLRLGNVELRKPELLVQAAKRYAGQTTEIVFSRMGEEQHQSVVLNSLQ